LSPTTPEQFEIGVMTIEDFEILRGHAFRFRRALEQCRPQLASVPAFKSFPHGSCGDTCELLGRYLEQVDSGTWTSVSGQRGANTHAWLEKVGVIVDITADQFTDGPGPVFVSRDRSWHDQFQQQQRSEVGTSVPSAVVARQLVTTYAIILSQIGADTGAVFDS
jgi:hypothetical protein